MDKDALSPRRQMKFIKIFCLVFAGGAALISVAHLVSYLRTGSELSREGSLVAGAGVIAAGVLYLWCKALYSLRG